MTSIKADLVNATKRLDGNKNLCFKFKWIIFKKSFRIISSNATRFNQRSISIHKTT